MAFMPNEGIHTTLQDRYAVRRCELERSCNVQCYIGKFIFLLTIFDDKLSNLS